MSELPVKEKIEDLIYEIRGLQVILDSDLARLYECTNGTKDINKVSSLIHKIYKKRLKYSSRIKCL